MGNISKGQQPDQREENNQKPQMAWSSMQQIFEPNTDFIGLNLRKYFPG